MSDQEKLKTQATSAEDEPSAGMGRRHWITAGVAAVAGLAGAFVAWQKYQPQGVLEPDL